MKLTRTLNALVLAGVIALPGTSGLAQDVVREGAVPIEDQPAAKVAPAPEGERPLIQIALLLDTSNSMDGLIAQAKTHLWKVVNEFATAKQDGQRPILQVALYEYGNDGLSAGEGYIRLVAPLTDDLDKISEELFALRTNGGQEYCGHVIRDATNTLEWSKDNHDFKAIFIAGNEPFTQGEVAYAESCKAAITRGIIVNTIFCGPFDTGVNTKWKDGAALADGKYMNIDQNQRVAHIDAPQDKEIAELNAELNKTYVGYGAEGDVALERQAAQDANASGLSSAVLSQRANAKASSLYRNANWDLVDAAKEKDFDIDKVKNDDLPEEMQKMSKDEKLKYIAEKQKEREQINQKIQELSDARRKHVAEEMKRQAEQSGEETFDKAVVDMVQEQAQRSGFEFEKEEK